MQSLAWRGGLAGTSAWKCLFQGKILARSRLIFYQLVGRMAHLSSIQTAVVQSFRILWIKNQSTMSLKLVIKKVIALVILAHVSLGAYCQTPDSSSFINQIDSLNRAARKAFVFDRGEYDKVSTELHIIDLYCKAAKVVDIHINSVDSSVLGKPLLANLKRELLGYTFSLTVPEHIYFSVALINPFSTRKFNSQHALFNVLKCAPDVLQSNFWFLGPLLYAYGMESWKRRSI
ncbi:MAG TPA: hypothetical protein VFR58_12100 [Flavisolibacter sp.]|nr:hypothetical protein [Flavisolibacter sp.]